MTLEKKIQHAIKLLHSIPTDNGPIEVSYSGGKDSDVILELAKMAEIPFEAIYKNTTIDPPGTIRHVKDMGATIVQPKKTFLECIEYAGWPSQWHRFCCSFLKEYKVKDRAIHGIRRSESTKRAMRYKEPEVCRVYNNKDKVRVYLPILEWTDEDVESFIKERNIKCHPLYYDENGNFCVNRRLGCIGCPLKSDKGRADFVRYPKFFIACIRAYQRWWDAHQESKTAKLFPNVYDAVYMKLFCRDMEEYLLTTASGQLFDNERVRPKEFMEGYFGIKFEDNHKK